MRCSDVYVPVTGVLRARLEKQYFNCIERKGFTVTKLASETSDLSYSTLNEIVSGKRKTVHQVTMEKIEKWLKSMEDGEQNNDYNFSVKKAAHITIHYR